MTANTSALVVALTLILWGARPPTGYAQRPSTTSSVVQFFVHSDPPDMTMPWQTEGASLYGGSGVIIDDNRILTNAHVVEYAVGIEVKRADASEREAAVPTSRRQIDFRRRRVSLGRLRPVDETCNTFAGQ